MNNFMDKTVKTGVGEPPVASTFIWERETDADTREPVFERISGVAYVEQGPTHLVFRDAEGSVIIGLRASDVVSFFEED